VEWGEEGGNRHLNAKIVKKQANLFIKMLFFVDSQNKTGNEGESFKEQDSPIGPIGRGTAICSIVFIPSCLKV
jgi:hypothetical protein